MHEVLFSSSPITLVLSCVALVIAIFFPFSIGQKIRSRQLPRPVYQYAVILCVWNNANIIGNLFCGGYEHTIFRQVIFGIQALAWVQLGNAAYRVGELNFKIRHTHVWTVMNILGGLSVITLTVLFCTIPEKMATLFSLPINGLENRPVFVAFSIVFAIFVMTPLVSAGYVLIQKTILSSDLSLSQIGTYMLAAFTFFVIVPITFDFVLPLAYNFKMDGGEVTFLQWFQYCALFIAIIDGQYFTSISFKNKSSNWFLNSLLLRLSDGVLYFSSKGDVVYANPAAQQLFQCSEAEFKKIKVQDLLPGIDVFQEAYYENVKVQIKDELHTFNVGLFGIHQSMTTTLNALLLSDQTNLLFYQQRIKTLNRQFAEYKQDLIRYQDRLDISEKKSKETENINVTLINALPFQFWSKNENGVYQTQNQQDIAVRGNLNKTTDPIDSISPYEQKARDNGINSVFTSYEDANHNVITEEQASMDLKNEKAVYTYQNHFIPIITNRPPYKVIGLKIDLSEEKRLERERNILREQKIIHSRLEDLGTACGAFAHDYNNILGSQIGFCELAHEILGTVSSNASDKKVKAQLDSANNFVLEATKAAKRGKESLNVLLDTVRGKTESKIEDTVFPPTDIVRDVINKLIITLPPNIKITAEQLDDSIKVKAQAPSMERILSNLSNNAVYAMKETGGTLGFSVTKESLLQQIVSPHAPPIPTGDYVKISVSDTGTGMDSGTLERIFAPFFTTKAPGEGLGLGLSSALRLLKEGNAYFTIQTTIGEGTKFNLYWKLYKEI